MHAFWQVNSQLAKQSRWRVGVASASQGAASEFVILVALGVVAALATCWLPLGLRLPGHAILRGTLPLVLGLSIVPRRSAGTLMSLSAGMTFVLLKATGVMLPNAAALTGVLCLGPALDFVLSKGSSGWKLYLSCATAGLAANLVAFAVRFGSGFLGQEPVHSRGMINFWPVALISFAIFGIVAGLLGGWIAFRSRPTSLQE